MGIRFSISRKAITHLIQSSGHPSLKIANCREYLEPQDGLSGSMRNSNLIHSDLSASGPSTLSIFFTLEIKGMGRGFSCTEGGKVAVDLENVLMAIAWIEILQQKCDHSAPMLRLQSQFMVVIYFRLFLELNIVKSKIKYNMIQII
jgi:hypothetical protein